MTETLRLKDLIPDPVSGEFVRLEYGGLQIAKDWEMTLQVDIIYVDKDDVPLAGRTPEGVTLTQDQMNRLMNFYRGQTKSVSTRGFKVDPRTGAQVQIDENGNWPEGSIDERLLWLAAKADEVPGDTVFQKVAAMIMQALANLTARGRI